VAAELGVDATGSKHAHPGKQPRRWVGDKTKADAAAAQREAGASEAKKGKAAKTHGREAEPAASGAAQSKRPRRGRGEAGRGK